VKHTYPERVDPSIKVPFERVIEVSDVLIGALNDVSNTAGTKGTDDPTV
jgi:hypothetical protein